MSNKQKFVSRREYYCDSPPCICRPPCYTPNDHQTQLLHNLTNIWGYGCLFVCCAADVFQMCSVMCTVCKAMPQKLSAKNVEYSGKILFPFFQRLIRHSLKLIKEVQTKLLNPSEFFLSKKSFLAIVH